MKIGTRIEGDPATIATGMLHRPMPPSPAASLPLDGAFAATGEGRFGLRGFPNIPGQDAVLRYASNGDANQGVVL